MISFPDAPDQKPKWNWGMNSMKEQKDHKHSQPIFTTLIEQIKPFSTIPAHPVWVNIKTYE